jgi:hypothetical protein
LAELYPPAGQIVQTELPLAALIQPAEQIVHAVLPGALYEPAQQLEQDELLAALL